MLDQLRVPTWEQGPLETPEWTAEDAELQEFAVLGALQILSARKRDVTGIRRLGLLVLRGRPQSLHWHLLLFAQPSLHFFFVFLACSSSCMACETSRELQ